MDKKKIKRIALVLLPLIAMVIAGMSTSVTVYVPDADVAYCSFFTYIEDVPVSICMPFAAIFGAVGFGMSLIYLARKTAFWVKGLMICSMVSASLAVLPLVMRSEVYLIPNMWFPILMLVVCILAYYTAKEPQEEKKPEGKRLEHSKKK